MPLSVSTPYATKNSASARIPAYFVTFGDTDTKYSTHPEFTGGFAAGPGFEPGFFDVIPGPVPLEEGTTAFPYMAGISVSGGRVRPQEGSSSTGSLSVTLLDFGGAITALIAANVIAPGRSMTLYTGFGDISLGDFAVWMRGVIDDVQMPETRVYVITAMERSSFQSQQVFHPAITKINTALSAGRLAIDLDSLAFFTAPSGGGSGYMVIDDEAIRFEAFDSGSVLDEAQLEDGRLEGNVLNDPNFSASGIVESENILAEWDFATNTKWQEAGDWSFAGGKAVYTHSTASGNLFQTQQDGLTKLIQGERYRFTYTLASLTGTITVLRISSPFGGSAIDLPISNGTHSVEFLHGSGDFQIHAESSSGGFTLDDFSLKRLQLVGKWRRDGAVSVENDGDFTLSGGGAVYAHVAGEGTIRQNSADLLLPLQSGSTYRLDYTLSNVTGTITSLTIQSPPAGSPVTLPAVNGAASVEFTAQAGSPDFKIRATSSSGGFTLSGLSLVRLASFTGILAAERGALGSMAAEHSEGAQVRELFRLAGHPLDIALGVLQNVGNLGMEILPEEIDLASFAAIKALDPALEFEFLISAQEEGRQWLEEQIFAPLGCFLVTSADGTLRLRSIALDDATNTITDDHILAPPTWRGNFGEAINALGVSYDHQMAGDVFHPASSDYGGRIVQEDATILETDRRQNEHHLRGLRSALVDAEQFIEEYGAMIFARFALGPATVNARVMLAKHVIEQGDFVELSCTFLPSRITGNVGVTEALALVLSRDLDFVSGDINLELQLMGIEDAAKWAPEFQFPLGTETYGTASAEQKDEFAFWANEDGENSSEHLSNGAFDSGDGWAIVNDFAIAAGVLTYAHAVGGIVSQAVADMAQPLTPGATYKLIYTVVAQSGNAVAWIPSGLATANVVLDMALGAHEVEFTVDAGYPTEPGHGFLLTGGDTSTGGFTLDNLSVVPAADAGVSATAKNWR